MVIHTAAMKRAILLDDSCARARHRKIYDSYFKSAVAYVPCFRNFKPRLSSQRPNYMDSTWGKILRDKKFRDPTMRRGGKLFRRRFRVPYPMFLELVKITRENKWFSEGPDCTGRPSAPLELKVLAVLRVLGRGYCFDGVEELCFISAEVLRNFFNKFCELFAAKYFDVYCNYPRSKEEIKISTGMYARMGLPGCIGSTDCVHFGWDRCPSGEISQHKGKEGFPTLSYEVTVDRNKKIIACTTGHPGARNDQTTVKFDEFITKINEGELYKDEEYEVYEEVDGILRRTVLKGLYVACDNGYPKWPCMQCPLKHSSEAYESRWSKWLETVRKDVECTFGILKGRFRCLKLPVFYHSKKT